MDHYESLNFGYRYQPEATAFKVFAKDCDGVQVCLYKDAKTHRQIAYDMSLLGNGIWQVSIHGDLKGQFYTYRLRRGVEYYVATDPFAYSSSLDSSRSAIIDLKDAYVEGFEQDTYMPYAPQEALIYETHIRDMTMDPSLNLKYPGKYLGVCEVLSDKPYGLSYLKALGITHLHFLPLQDFLSVKELDPEGYNWGYDPEHYFVPEGSYATDPEDPLCRVREVRAMVKTCHDKGLAVILDVVYNHTYRGLENPLSILAPKQYYRHQRDGSFCNGSGCGNELDTENPMARQLIVDSLLHWMRTYHIDGFRFDLMALMDIETAKIVVAAIRAENPKALIYGEPWTGGPSCLHWDKQVLKGKQHELGIALFNDDYRTALKGDSDGKDHGFIQGYKAKMHDIKTGIVGSIQYDKNHRGFCIEPLETINYITAHDNLCLYDKLKYSTMWQDAQIKAATKMSMALMALSFGIPFLQAGSEFMRTKQMDHNSYRSSDAINAIQWQQVLEHHDLVAYTKDLFALRRDLKCFHTFSAKDIKHHVRFIAGIPILGYTIALDAKGHQEVVILINPQHHQVDLAFKRSDTLVTLFDNRGYEPMGHGQHLPSAPIALAAFETIVLKTLM